MVLDGVREGEGDGQQRQRPQQDVDPPGRLEAELHPEHQRHEEGAEEEDDEHGGSVAGILLPEIQAAGVAALGDLQDAGEQPRSERRRVGKECVSTGRSRWSPEHVKKKTEKEINSKTNT